ncbi:type I DNA topoisomerase [Candidatus Shapirobacteria bacterium]|nr:type I DNA topoisomerase [Candidatus Shapirobacteria bacterium]
MKKLLIVESPTKARTIGKYLGSDYEVVATVGHLRDLPSSKMGVDLTTFEPEYVVSDDKKKVVAELTRASKTASQIVLASDPDREGEAIAWHVKTILENSKIQNPNSKSGNPGTSFASHIPKNKKQVPNVDIVRATFHEITKSAIEDALKTPREIDMNLVDAQQGRRVLDRVVGYSLSPVLWKKVRRGLSAGRVQSVAVRLICERENEINSFSKEKFFRISADLEKGVVADLIKVANKNIEVVSKLDLFDGQYSYTKTIYTDKNEVEKFVSALSQEFVVAKMEEKETNRNPLPPYTTSKLQQAAARRFGWSGKQTMSLAQRLYEQGLITYHRTDAVNLSDKAVAEFREFIIKKYGANYVSPVARKFKNTSKNAQEAHEAIRPTNVSNYDINGLDNKELKLYQLIWKRAVATQGASAKMKSSTIDFTNGPGLFRTSGVVMLFEGFLKITEEKHEEQVLPQMKIGDKIKSKKINIVEASTSPPPRYSDASLVGSLEKQGIGRPSTYAPIISTIQARQYVEKEEGRFYPTALGVAANEFLVKNFPDILSLPFTAEMEEDLDEVATGKVKWKEMMKTFWKKFDKEVKLVEKDADRVKVAVEKLDEKCPECKEGELVVRTGKFGKFVSCDRFPDCKYTRQFKELAGFNCPTCGKEGVVRKTKTGRKFFGCSDYPNCKWAGWKKP